MRIGGVTQAQAYQRPRPRVAEAEGAAQALVAVEPAPRAEDNRFGERRVPEAALLAHFIAVFDDAPQLRLKRRASPAEAVAAYGATRAVTAAQTGQTTDIDA